MKVPQALAEQYTGLGVSISRSIRWYFLAKAGSRAGRDLVAMLLQHRRRDFVRSAVLKPAGARSVAGTGDLGRWLELTVETFATPDVRYIGTGLGKL